MDEKLFGFDLEQQWDYENGYYITSHITRMAKMLAHFELYKSIIHLPGHVIEAGVFKGASFIRFCTFREILESPHSRKIIGFDAFGKFPVQDDTNDQDFVEKFEGVAGEGISEDEMQKVLDYKGIGNVELIKGDVSETIPQYIEDHPELKLSLLHIDVDVYKPSVVILENLYDRVVNGGLIILDDYGTVSGETRAVDEFVSDKDVTIEKLSISHIPSYIRKC